jgi:hypothetical protein
MFISLQFLKSIEFLFLHTLKPLSFPIKINSSLHFLHLPFYDDSQFGTIEHPPTLSE